ncbi:aminopeptidase A [Volucribacter psittacicida]|uniref:Probable cytosol aminopeptidase n=1 Tax=Volucribacter psittacicida TaxID=203482 RepID=A0A4R1GBR1_9PAST|nr:leucyl aminopeptidase [Volucribacter psittacicida]TCK01712.1 aminopeptidase A [Volucribacter psittacicida]
MQYNVKNTDFNQLDQQCLILAVYQEKKLSPTAAQFDQQHQHILSNILAHAHFSGKQGEHLLLQYLPEVKPQHILLIGCGEENSLSPRQYKKLIQHTFAQIKQIGCKEIINALTDIAIPQRDDYWNIRWAIETFAEQTYCFDSFKSEKNSPLALTQCTFHLVQQDTTKAEQAIQHANAIALGVKAAKDIANMPPNICNPAYLADQAYALAKSSALIQTQVINQAEMQQLGMNAYLAVASGSNNEAYLSIMEYKNHPDNNAQPIVLVGKGLTFDAGGISLKPADAMDEMKYDMCGAATVYGVMKAVAELNLPLNVIGVLAGCENLPDGNAYRPGDILTTMKGLTVEVLNTDAEGRLVLADTLTYVERFDPALVIDVATLTGACVVALGQHNSGLISTQDDLAQALQQAAQQSTDQAWRLPLSEEYQEQLKSNFADLANIGGRWGGAITAGAFLANFTKNYPWAHLDIAGTAWLQGVNKGATGRPVPLLVQFLLNQAQA